MTYTLNFNKLWVNLGVFFLTKNGASNMVDAQMKFASEARPSQYINPFGNTEPTSMSLSG